MSTGFKAVALLCLASCLSPASAQRVVLDDSLSPRESHAVQLDWEKPVIGRAIAAILAGATDTVAPMTGRIPGVEVRLDTRSFESQDVRIYLTIPATVAGLENPGALELSWEAALPFLSGATRPGQSALIFEGRIEQSVTIAVFDFALLLQGDLETESLELEPVYELEVSI